MERQHMSASRERQANVHGMMFVEGILWKRRRGQKSTACMWEDGVCTWASRRPPRVHRAEGHELARCRLVRCDAPARGEEGSVRTCRRNELAEPEEENVENLRWSSCSWT